MNGTMNDTPRGFAPGLEFGPCTRHHVVPQSAGDQRLGHRLVAIGRGGESVRQNDKQVEIAVRTCIAPRSASEQPNHPGPQPADQPVTQKNQRSRLVSERADRARRCVGKKPAKRRFMALAQKVGNGLQDIALLGQRPHGLNWSSQSTSFVLRSNRSVLQSLQFRKRGRPM